MMIEYEAVVTTGMCCTTCVHGCEHVWNIIHGNIHKLARSQGEELYSPDRSWGTRESAQHEVKGTNAE